MAQEKDYDSEKIDQIFSKFERGSVYQRITEREHLLQRYGELTYLIYVYNKNLNKLTVEKSELEESLDNIELEIEALNNSKVNENGRDLDKK